MSEVRTLARAHHANAPLAALAGSQVIAQLCLLAVTPFITRHYDSATIGAYQIILVVVLVLSPIATLRAELPITGPIDAASVRQLRRWAAWSTLVMTSLFAIAAATAPLFADNSFELLLAGSLLAVTAVSTIDSALLLRRGAIWLAASRNLIAGGLAAGLQIALVDLNDPLLAICGALVLARFVALIVTLRPHRSLTSIKEDPTAFSNGEPGSRRELVASILSGSVSMVGANLLLIVLGFALTAETVGQLAVATRLSSAPLTLLGIAFTQVVVARFGRALREDPRTVHWLLRKWTRTFTALAAVSAAVVASAGLWGHTLLLGTGWSQAGQMASILAVAGAAQLAVVPFLGLFAQIGRAGTLARSQIVRVALLSALLYICLILSLPILATLAVYAIGSAAMYGGLAMQLNALTRSLAPETSISEERESVR